MSLLLDYWNDTQSHAEIVILASSLVLHPLSHVYLLSQTLHHSEGRITSCLCFSSQNQTFHYNCCSSKIHLAQMMPPHSASNPAWSSTYPLIQAWTSNPCSQLAIHSQQLAYFCWHPVLWAAQRSCSVCEMLFWWVDLWAFGCGIAAHSTEMEKEHQTTNPHPRGPAYFRATTSLILMENILGSVGRTQKFAGAEKFAPAARLVQPCHPGWRVDPLSSFPRIWVLLLLSIWCDHTGRLEWYERSQGHFLGSRAGSSRPRICRCILVIGFQNLFSIDSFDLKKCD